MKGLSIDASVIGDKLSIKGVENLKDSYITGLSTLADSDTDRYADSLKATSFTDRVLKAESIKDRLGNLTILIERRC